MSKRFPDIFPLVYDAFTTDLPYSLDAGYPRNTKKRPIQIIEKLSPLSDCLAKVVYRYKNNVVDELYTILTTYLQRLYDNGITYTDLKLDNVAYGIYGDEMRIKLLDVEGVHLSKHPDYDPKDTVQRFIKYEVIPAMKTTKPNSRCK